MFECRSAPDTARENGHRERGFIMRTMNIAIIGLQSRGEVLLDQLISRYHPRINIVCAVEAEEGPARRKAAICGIALVELDELLGFVDEIDVIFDLRDDVEMNRQLRQVLAYRDNHHTHLFSENALELMSILLAERPDVRAA